MPLDARVAGVLLVVLGYVGLALGVRALYVAWTARRLLLAQIDGVEARLELEQQRPGRNEPGESEVAKGVRELLAVARRENPGGWAAIPNTMIFWNGARELQGWRLVHEAERLLVWQLDDEAVLARMRRAAIDLASLPPDEAANWAKVLAPHLAEGRNRPRAESRAALREVLAAINNHVDASYSSLIELQNKAMWLLTVGLVAALILALAFPGAQLLLLAGAVGGLLNRMRRIFTAKDLPTDYGASWGPLFLSPVVGSLTGWAGVQLLVLAQLLDIVKLESLDLGTPTGAGALSVALLMGFAEQWFDQVSEQLQQQTERGSQQGSGT
jgi:hypothetical protein